MKVLIAGVAIVAASVAAGTGLAVAGGADDDTDDTDAPIEQPALDKASAAALDEAGGGKVTETEAGDDGSAYEVEVTLDDGSEVEVDLDEDFEVVRSEKDDDTDDASETDDDD
jgi:uncharacterized membrane protein YkoI